MVASISTDSSSEDEEIKKRLKEAVVNFEVLKNENENLCKNKYLKLDHNIVNEDISEDHHNLNLTPEYKDFVAKKLKLSIENKIEFFQNSQTRRSKKNQSKRSSHFQVFKNVYMNDEIGNFSNCTTLDSSKKK